MYMKLNRLFLYVLSVFVFFGSTGCTIFGGGKNKNVNKEAMAKAKVENVESLMSTNLKDKLDQVANLNYGVGYALSKETDPSKNVKVATDLNTRSISLTGTPSIDEINKMKQMIDDLTSQLNTEKERGAKSLQERDTQIAELQQKTKDLEIAKDTEIKKYMKIAADTAAKADASQAELDKMNNFFGFGAIWYGIKRLITRLAWFIGIGSVLYIILRFASMSNPLAASLFSIFDTIMSWFVNIIKVLAPKAVEIAGHTATIVAEKYKKTMTKMIDVIQTLKEHQKASGDSHRKYTLDELMVEFSKALNDDEKKMVSQIKNDIGFSN